MNTPTRPASPSGLLPNGRDADIISKQQRYRVKYYDPHRGGVWIRTFVDEQAAAEFAVGRRLYAKPARVEPIGEKP